MKTIKQNLYFLNLSFSSKKQSQVIKAYLTMFLFFISICPKLFSQDFSNHLNNDSTIIKPDYRNHINIPEYNPALMPLDRQTSSTGVWTELNPNVPRVDYIGVHFVNKDTGWACGANGTIIKTTNGGVSWTSIVSNTTTTILKITSFNGQIVIASGYDGLILRSTDGGETFAQVTSGVGNGVDLWGLQMINDTLGWVCGLNQTLLKTTNAGQSWQIFTTGLNQHYWALDFINDRYGMIACGDGKVLKSTDGGNNWLEIQGGDARAFYTIDIIDSLHIIAAGALGKNIYSSDGGLTWIINPDLPTFTATNCISFFNKDTGYSVQDLYQIRKTTDRGQSWFNPNTINSGGEWNIQVLEDGTGYSVGQSLKIYKLTDEFENWKRLILNEDWSDVFFLNENKGFLISSYFTSGLYKTEDGGISYTNIDGAQNGSDLLFLDSLVGFIGSNTIYKTTDSGNNWYAVNGVPGGIDKIFFINSQVGWAIGGGNIYKTTDGGENWALNFSAPGSISFTNIYFVDTLYGWTANINGRPFKTTDGGLNWIQQTNLDIWDSRDVLFNNYSNGFLLESNKFYKTTTGGLSWTLDSGITGFSIAGRFNKYLDSTIFITGYHTYRSLDAGTSWVDYPELNGTKINGLSLLGKGFGFAVGDIGLILQYTDDTVPVELTKFIGIIANNTVHLNWSTSTETNNLGFYIERKGINDNWEKIGFVEGNGTTTLIHHYLFIDRVLSADKYCYRLKQTDFDGKFEYSDMVEVEVGTPSDFFLSQNYPNPFNPETKIDYRIPEETLINITLYDITGRKIKELVNEKKQPGYYTLKLKGGALSSGIYFYRLSTSNGYIIVKKLTILK